MNGRRERKITKEKIKAEKYDFLEVLSLFLFVCVFCLLVFFFFFCFRLKRKVVDGKTEKDGEIS